MLVRVGGFLKMMTTLRCDIAHTVSLRSCWRGQDHVIPDSTEMSGISHQFCVSGCPSNRVAEVIPQETHSRVWLTGEHSSTCKQTMWGDLDHWECYFQTRSLLETWTQEMSLCMELTMGDTDFKMKIKLFYSLIWEKMNSETKWTKIMPTAVEQLIKLFDEYCDPSQNETVEILICLFFYYLQPRSRRENRNVHYQAENSGIHM